MTTWPTKYGSLFQPLNKLLAAGGRSERWVPDRQSPRAAESTEGEKLLPAFN